MVRHLRAEAAAGASGFRSCRRARHGPRCRISRPGFGEGLVRAALVHASRIGLERIELQVYSNNAAARALYLKAGFDVEGVRRRARKLDGRYDDLVLMALLLPSME